MSGSTLEAMAQAVEESAAVLICVSKKYKDSQACRTEAEYAFQQRKKIIPVVMESGFKPTGWLGALMGTRLYFDMSDARRIPAKMPHLMKELADSGKCGQLVVPKHGSSHHHSAAPSRPSTTCTTKENHNIVVDKWTSADVELWLLKTKLGEYNSVFSAKHVDGMALRGLWRISSDPRYVHELLEKELGMETLGHKLKFMEELHRLCS
ncbi:hypothetical protein CEUSTIGMA_g3745.t1 [Chlamydomonas eustigma]|uniref:SAM domain-containing protein n=1 Tax=Chlamydomonas eustigma TaxID=1157962 RepID=A0A250X0L9_9CHLO|nr:hypothetical protein CEUSTIGMA_g3745.t1 [Chlamydomonas eustigma]|eukprot:GAX76300.1 hypothetical protein CEUSTIGMA_g3745.t1 [Chlamydomonas eustigma]